MEGQQHVGVFPEVWPQPHAASSAGQIKVPLQDRSLSSSFAATSCSGLTSSTTSGGSSSMMKFGARSETVSITWRPHESTGQLVRSEVVDVESMSPKRNGLLAVDRPVRRGSNPMQDDDEEEETDEDERAHNESPEDVLFKTFHSLEPHPRSEEGDIDVRGNHFITRLRLGADSPPPIHRRKKSNRTAGHDLNDSGNEDPLRGSDLTLQVSDLAARVAERRSTTQDARRCTDDEGCGDVVAKFEASGPLAPD